MGRGEKKSGSKARKEEGKAKGGKAPNSHFWLCHSTRQMTTI